MAWTVRHRSVSLLARVCSWFTEGFDTADPAHINTRALGRALAETLADRHAALIRAHGAVLVAESVPAVFIDIVHFTENAETLYRAAALGPVTALTQAEMSSFLERFDRPRHVAKLWRYYLGRCIRSGAVPESWAEQAGEPT